jgi:hypothetical protein
MRTYSYYMGIHIQDKSGTFVQAESARVRMKVMRNGIKSLLDRAPKGHPIVILLSHGHEVLGMIEDAYEREDWVQQDVVLHGEALAWHEIDMISTHFPALRNAREMPVSAIRAYIRQELLSL